MIHNVKTPPNLVIHTGDVVMQMQWDNGFGGRKTGDFNRAQVFIDSEVLRHCAPLMPIQTGTLIRSGTMATVIGSGEVQYNTPYAAKQYYGTATSRTYDPNRGGWWFERMKVTYRGAILNGAKKIGGGG